MIIVITGASSGIGRETARILADCGHTVYDLSRTDKPQMGVEHLYCDVTKRDTIDAAIQTIAQKEGRIDKLILCAGMGVAGSIEHTADGDMLHQFDVNTFGPIRVIQAALPVMRTQQQQTAPERGRIVFVGSMAGVFGIPFQAMYSATKAAINSFAFSLRNELHSYNIKVAVLMPNDVKTNFSRKTDLTGSDVYPTMQPAIEQMERDEAKGLSAQAVARKVVRATMRSRVGLYYTSDFMSDVECLLQRLLPTSTAAYVVRKLYHC